MNGILGNSLVGLALIISTGYAVASLGPRSLRRRFLSSLSRVAARAPAFLGLKQFSERLAGASAGKAKGACGGCDDCGSAQDSRAAEIGAPEIGSAETRVPLTKVGRRN